MAQNMNLIETCIDNISRVELLHDCKLVGMYQVDVVDVVCGMPRQVLFRA